MFKVTPKFPGLCAMLAIGLVIGAFLNKDYGGGMFVAILVALDCFSFDKVD